MMLGGRWLNGLYYSPDGGIYRPTSDDGLVRVGTVERHGLRVKPERVAPFVDALDVQLALMTAEAMLDA